MATLKKIVPSVVLSDFSDVAPEGAAHAWGGIADALDAAENYLEPAAHEEMKRRGQEAGVGAGQGMGPSIEYSGGGGGDATLSLLREFEGFSETPYWDVNAYRAGYGSDTITSADGTVSRIAKGSRVSRSDAELDLSRRVREEFQPAARNAVGAEVFDALSPGRQAALNSLSYNYGAGAWSDDLASVAKAVKSGDPTRASEAISALSGHNGGVNKKRREREAEIFLTDGNFAPGPTTVAIMSNGKTAVLPENPFGGKLGATYAAAAQTAYLSEVQNTAIVDLMEMSNRFVSDPEGFKAASQEYINQVAEDAPGEYAAGVRSSLAGVAVRRMTGLMAEKQADIRQRALNASRATIDRLSNDYASLMAAGDGDAATAAGIELQEALRVRERLPGSRWTPEQSAGAMADARELATATIKKQRKERAGEIKADLDATIKAAKNGRVYANEDILSDPEVMDLHPELAREARAYVEVRDATKPMLALPPSVLSDQANQMAQQEVHEEWEVDAVKSVATIAKENAAAWKKDPIARAFEVMPVEGKPPEIDLPVDGDMQAFTQSLNARLGYARQLVEGGYSDQLIVFSDQERDQISTLFHDEVPPEVRAVAAGALHAGLGDASMKVFETLKVDKTTRIGGMMMAAGADQATVARAFEGQMLLDTKAVTAPGTGRFSEVAGGDLKAAFEGVPGAIEAQDEVVSFARAIYAAGKSGDMSKAEEKSAMAEAVQVALGQGKNLRGEITGGVQEVFGNKTLLPMGMVGSDADDALRIAIGGSQHSGAGFLGGLAELGEGLFGERPEPEVIQAAWAEATAREGNEGSPPMWNGKPLDAAAIGDDLRIVPFGGSYYRMEVRGMPAEDARGNVFIFDLEKLVGALQ